MSDEDRELNADESLPVSSVKPDLPDHLRGKCALGNAMLDVTLEFDEIQLTVKNETGHENPWTSWQFQMPQLIAFVIRWAMFVVESHYCMFGAMWKKPTGIRTESPRHAVTAA